jgi:pimeloyl-ACP methyl ester carboxylesterase
MGRHSDITDCDISVERHHRGAGDSNESKYPTRKCRHHSASAGRISVLDRKKFHASFAADVETGKAEFMADSQVPWGVRALAGTISEPAWKKKPSWYLVATDDKMIPPPAQRLMSQRAGSKAVEVAGSHSIYMSQPDAVATLIKDAAKRAATAAN